MIDTHGRDGTSAHSDETFDRTTGVDLVPFAVRELGYRGYESNEQLVTHSELLSLGVIGLCSVSVTGLVAGDSTSSNCGLDWAWLGASVTDLNDVPIVGWTLTSGSGFDFSRSFPGRSGRTTAPALVPEPGTIALFGIALAAVVRHRRV